MTESTPLAKQIEALESQVEGLQNDLETAREQQMRALADLQNVQRREAEQKAKWAELSVGEFIRKLLPSFLELSLGGEHSEDEAVKSVIAKFFETLKKEELVRIEPSPGEAVDPEKHEVLLAAESETPGVVQCLEPGWIYKETVIIPAKISATQN